MPQNDDLRRQVMDALQGIARHQAWIESHDRDCARRYGELRDMTTGIHKLLWKVASASIGTLLCVAGYLVAQYLHLHP